MWLAWTEIHVANSTIFFDNNRKLKKPNDETLFSIWSFLTNKECFSYAEFSPVSRFACLTFRNFRKLADSQPVELRHFENKVISGCQRSQGRHFIYRTIVCPRSFPLHYISDDCKTPLSIQFYIWNRWLQDTRFTLIHGWWGWCLAVSSSSLCMASWKTCLVPRPRYLAAVNRFRVTWSVRLGYKNWLSLIK